MAHSGVGISAQTGSIQRRPQQAKLNGQDPWAFLKDVFERLPTLKNADLHLLLPHLWTAPSATAVPTITSPAFA